jgi:hypothetical protein
MEKDYSGTSKRKKICRRLCAPTIEEICKITQCPERGLKLIVYTMTSSGIGLGALAYLQWDTKTSIACIDLET